MASNGAFSTENHVNLTRALARGRGTEPVQERDGAGGAGTGRGKAGKALEPVSERGISHVPGPGSGG